MTTEPAESEYGNDDIDAGALAVLIAVLDGECAQRIPDLLYREDEQHYASLVAHRLAHMFVDSFDEEHYAEMRADLAAEALRIAGQSRS